MKRKWSKEEFINVSSLVHNNKYDYSLVDFKDMYTKVTIVCPIHGPFLQRPYDHAYWKAKCPKCAIEENARKQRISREEFIQKASVIHNNKYDYRLVDYIDSKTKVTIVCPTHGPFLQIPNDHLNGNGCPKCSNTSSSIEEEIADWLESLISVEIQRRVRHIIPPLELDIYIPTYSLAIEVNGLWWHSDMYHPDPNYHLRKLVECRTNGIKLVQIFEDEWLYKRDVVKSIIRGKLGLISNKIYARCCKVEKVDSEKAKTFYENNHIQYYVPTNAHHYSLVYKDDIVMMLSIARPRFNQNVDWEILRLCTKVDTVVVGGLSKLMSVISTIFRGVIISYVDRRLFDGSGYERCGWKLVGTTPPNYYYVNSGHTIRESRQKYQKHKLSALFPDVYRDDLSEYEIMKKCGYHRVYDCGNLVYVYNDSGNNVMGSADVNTSIDSCGVSDRLSRVGKSKFMSFLEKAALVHNNKYDYSLVDFKNMYTKVTIVCPIHGPFLQRPEDHVDGHGCPKCGYSRAHLRKPKIVKQPKKVHSYQTIKTFINEKFGSRYSLILGKNVEETERLSLETKVKLKCNICSTEFTIRVEALLKSTTGGCPECKKQYLREKFKVLDFIEKAKKVHSNKYDYSLVEYVNNTTPVTIICPIHGPFLQRPHNHIYNKSGCPKCSNNYQYLTSEFIEKAREVHSDRFDYSLTT